MVSLVTSSGHCISIEVKRTHHVGRVDRLVWRASGEQPFELVAGAHDHLSIERSEARSCGRLFGRGLRRIERLVYLLGQSGLLLVELDPCLLLRLGL